MVYKATSFCSQISNSGNFYIVFTFDGGTLEITLRLPLRPSRALRFAVFYREGKKGAKGNATIYLYQFNNYLAVTTLLECKGNTLHNKVPPGNSLEA